MFHMRLTPAGEVDVVADERVEAVPDGERRPGQEPGVLVSVPGAAYERAGGPCPGPVEQGNTETEADNENHYNLPPPGAPFPRVPPSMRGGSGAGAAVHNLGVGARTVFGPKVGTRWRGSVAPPAA